MGLDGGRVPRRVDAATKAALLGLIDMAMSEGWSHRRACGQLGCAIAQHFGRLGTPKDQAWIESFFGHLKFDFPHLSRIEDAAVLAAELEHARYEYNGVRLHAGIGYVTPDDEHEGRGPAIRKARRDGLAAARARRIAFRRTQRDQNHQPPP